MVDRRVPLDVILEILVWLPAKSALRFKCVCKEWYDLINTPLFAKLQLNKSLKPDSRHNRILICDVALGIISIVDDLYDPLKWIKLNWPKDTIRHGETIRVVGSCNGLVCYNVRCWNDANPTVRCFLICNPTTRNFISILGCSETKWMEGYLSYGFGYDIEHDDYKIVATSDIWTENDSRHLCVYSLKTGLWSWSYLPNGGSIGRYGKIINAPKYSNNILYYLVSHDTQGLTLKRIARFDIVSEKWKDDLTLPVQVNNVVQIGKLDGWLYILAADNFGCSLGDIWMMEEDGSWKKMFHLPIVLRGRCPIAHSGCHSLLFQVYNSDRIELFWYDQRDNTRTPFKLSETMPRDIGLYMLCIASLVAIPGGCSLTKLQQLEDVDYTSNVLPPVL
ncbi:F-box/kelch-repeat protein At3g23880-like [Silene latifolia]|uniref:F-box/kelch-repeat protein At3g23880-like n=1 Tax=Silene latifolia TaxID=37657 RepID=UPI003D777457